VPYGLEQTGTSIGRIVKVSIRFFHDTIHACVSGYLCMAAGQRNWQNCLLDKLVKAGTVPLALTIVFKKVKSLALKGPSHEIDFENFKNQPHPLVRPISVNFS
jgi:uncharacterized protein YgfB (UPF0149 family)